MTLTPWQRAIQARRQAGFQAAAHRMVQRAFHPQYVIPQTPPHPVLDQVIEDDDDWLDERWYPHDVSMDQMRLDANDEELEKWEDFVKEMKGKKNGR